MSRSQLESFHLDVVEDYKSGIRGAFSGRAKNASFFKRVQVFSKTGLSGGAKGTKHALAVCCILEV